MDIALAQRDIARKAVYSVHPKQKLSGGLDDEQCARLPGL
jgi:hypothetical protein